MMLICYSTIFVPSSVCLVPIALSALHGCQSVVLPEGDPQTPLSSSVRKDCPHLPIYAPPTSAPCPRTSDAYQYSSSQASDGRQPTPIQHRHHWQESVFLYCQAPDSLWGSPTRAQYALLKPHDLRVYCLFTAPSWTGLRFFAIMCARKPVL